ncbi:UvrD-helicase domain-containing protein [Patescibacteria group bacterium]|nr:UvrD-helicase domain-containing protein [Patescibacteria group bacterium]
MPASNLLEGLNPPQQEAVRATEGPVLILAGAGSGKTRALTHRFAYLLKEKGISPLQILCVTFTNKAAGEMKGRIGRLLGYTEEFSLPWLGTFHSVCVRILRREVAKVPLGISASFVIFDEGDALMAVKRAMEELKIDPKQYSPGAIRAQISGAKNEILTPDQYGRYAMGPFQQTVQAAYQKYQALLQKANGVDFDDILLKTLQLFEMSPETLAQYQERFRYIMVDEYQDTNRAQYLLIQRLAARNRNIFVIGDDWQSVYSWRGADFRNILDFQKDYPDAKVIKLEQNYRSTQTILNAAQAVISKNELRSEKELWTEGPVGVPITVVECLNEKDEAEFVVREILGFLKSSLYTGRNSYDDFVVLYRTNAQSRGLEETFLKYSVPYRIVGGVRFYERKEIKDMLAYLRLLQNPEDWVSLERVINVPARGIGPKTVTGLRGLEIRQIDTLPPKVQNFFRLMEELRNEIKGKTADQALETIFARTEYKKFLLDGSIEGESRFENVRELIGTAAGQDIEPFLQDVALTQDVDDLADTDHPEGAVTLMTVHAAKGLEFPVVFMVGMEEGIFPHSRTVTEKHELEEERRLAYVAMTRAKERLYLLHAFERRLYGALQSNACSRFVTDIPEELREKI